VKKISRYVLKEHAGPFLFALSALTSFMLLQFIARRFGDLVGRGLSWQVIVEFFILSIPLTVALTLPMSVLVAVLYAFSRLASENEITALKASGVSTRSLIRPVLVASVFLAFFMLWFNDQVLSSANHELATLQLAILRTKPSFALKEQVINPIKEGQLYLRAGYIDRDQSGRMRDITIYDVYDATKRRTIFADHGTLSFASNKTDLILHLYDGMMMSAPSNQPGQLDRIYYKEDEMRVKDVANVFKTIDADTTSKGDREMSVCEMQAEYEKRNIALQNAYTDSLIAVWRVMNDRGGKGPEPKRAPVPKVGGIGAIYCNFITKRLHIASPLEVKKAEAAEPLMFARHARQDTTRRDTTKQKDTTKKGAPSPSAKKPVAQSDSVMVMIGSILKKVPRNQIPPGAYIPDTAEAHTRVPMRGGSPIVNQPAGPPPIRPNAAPPVVAAPGRAGTAVPPGAVNPALRGATPPPSAGVATSAEENLKSLIASEVADSKIRLDDARHWRNRYAIEIQKKFSLAAACIVLVLVGAPMSLRFPRGGVGLVLIASFLIFAVYYVGLTSGEALANHNLISPFWAMWAGNIIFAIIGIALIARMGHETATARGGNIAELLDSFRFWLDQRRKSGGGAGGGGTK
jgi:lipopolysaccharide export system permease protein